MCVLNSLKCTVVLRGRSKSLCRHQWPCCCRDSSLRRSLKASAASIICTKNNYNFPHHIICTCLWHPVLLCAFHPGGHPSSVELIPGRSSRGNGKESNMLGDFYQSWPQWLSSKDIKLGVTAASEKPCLLLPALCRGCPCCLPTPRGGRMTQALMWRGCHCAELVGSLSGRYQKIGSLHHRHSLNRARSHSLTRAEGSFKVSRC